MKKIQLEITTAVIEYAKKYGAQYEKEYGWYCLEPIPIELEEFVISKIRSTQSDDDKYIQCPKCGGQMQLKYNFRNDMFWGCMSFPRCKGSSSADKTESQHFKKVLKATPDDKNYLVINYFQNYKALAELGMRELGGQIAFEKWLTKPKIALEGKRPIEIINTDEGYAKTMDLLREINH